jgi:hypothetical protein
MVVGFFAIPISLMMRGVSACLIVMTLKIRNLRSFGLKFVTVHRKGFVLYDVLT